MPIEVAVESSQLRNSIADLPTIVGAGGLPVATAFHASAGIADDMPFCEWADQVLLMWRQDGEGRLSPECQLGERLVAARQDVRRDEELADVAGAGAIRQLVQGFVRDLSSFVDELRQQSR
jgi:hypothetical protein